MDRHLLPEDFFSRRPTTWTCRGIETCLQFIRPIGTEALLDLACLREYLRAIGVVQLVTVNLRVIDYVRD